jgi:arsenite/tail-anchored protein-transporting ATPase
VSSDARQMAPNLWAEHLDPRLRMEQAWIGLQSYLTDVLRWAGVATVEAEELTVLPGLEEIVALSGLHEHVSSEAFDVVVVDCAPTAETIRLLSLPDALQWWITRVLPAGRSLTGLVAPIVSRVSDVPVAGSEVFDAIERLHGQLASVKDLFSDRERTAIRVVLTPERVVVAEARRTVMYLSLFGFGVDAVIVNRVLPDAVTDPWFGRWKQIHAEVLADIESGFAPLPVLTSELADDEPVGMDALTRLGDALWGHRDPYDIQHRSPVVSVVAREASRVLSVPMPFAVSKDLRLVRRGNELIVTMGTYRRSIAIPDGLTAMRVADAVARNGSLEVEFVVR